MLAVVASFNDDANAAVVAGCAATAVECNGGAVDEANNCVRDAAGKVVADAVAEIVVDAAEGC